MKNQIIKTALFALLGTVMISGSAFAQNQNALCRLLATHEGLAAPVPAQQPARQNAGIDWDAAYKPGVDVHGKPVVPADLGAQPVAPVADIVRIPLTVDLAKMINTQLPGFLDKEGFTGMVEIHQDGRVLFNGQDLTPATHTACGFAVPQIPEPEAVKAVQAPAVTAPAKIEPAAAPVKPVVPAAAPATVSTAAPSSAMGTANVKSLEPLRAPKAGQVVEDPDPGHDVDIIWGEGH